MGVWAGASLTLGTEHCGAQGKKRAAEKAQC